jgi:hypothetical protein
MRIKAELATGMDSPKPLASRLMRIGILLIVEVAALAAEQGTPSVPCAAELTLPDDVIAARLMSRNSERAQKLRHVDSIRQYNLDYTGLSSALGAQMQVNASYTAPGTKEFSVISESGSNLMRKRVLHKLLEAEQEAASDAANREAVQLSTTNYRFFLLGCESSGTRPLYVVRVEPLRESKILYRGTIWIDSQDFAVTRIEAEPAKSPSFWAKRSQIHHQYQKIGDFYLPALNQTVSDVWPSGRAVLTIRYFDYQLRQQMASAPENRP